MVPTQTRTHICVDKWEKVQKVADHWASSLSHESMSLAYWPLVPSRWRPMWPVDLAGDRPLEIFCGFPTGHGYWSKVAIDPWPMTTTRRSLAICHWPSGHWSLANDEQWPLDLRGDRPPEILCVCCSSLLLLRIAGGRSIDEDDRHRKIDHRRRRRRRRRRRILLLLAGFSAIALGGLLDPGSAFWCSLDAVRTWRGLRRRRRRSRYLYTRGGSCGQKVQKHRWRRRRRREGNRTEQNRTEQNRRGEEKRVESWRGGVGGVRGLKRFGFREEEKRG